MGLNILIPQAGGIRGCLPEFSSLGQLFWLSIFRRPSGEGMPLEAQQRLTELLACYGSHLSKHARQILHFLPVGWIGLVRSMLDRVEQILCDNEQLTFQWTDIQKWQGSLNVSWSGADDSENLVEQIVEETAKGAAETCVDCGASSLLGLRDSNSPRCLFHSTLRFGLDRTKGCELAASELIRNFRDALETASSLKLTPKDVAAALPLLLRESSSYFRTPDQDLQAIAQQLREAIQRLDEEMRKCAGLSLVAKNR